MMRFPALVLSAACLAAPAAAQETPGSESERLSRLVTHAAPAQAAGAEPACPPGYTRALTQIDPPSLQLDGGQIDTDIDADRAAAAPSLQAVQAREVDERASAPASPAPFQASLAEAPQNARADAPVIPEGCVPDPDAASPQSARLETPPN
jgi:hypothetical protein